MRPQRITISGFFAFLLGVALMLMGGGGTWTVYGQSAGPTPTPGVVSPIQAQKSVEPNTGSPGDTLTYTIDIQNLEDTPQENVVLRDTIPDFLEIIAVNTTKGTTAVNGQTVTVDIGTLEPNETVTITIQVRIRDSAQDGDTAINVAEVTVGPDGSTVTVPTNPVPVSVDQPPPAGLPDTGNAGNINIFLLLIGFGFAILGSGLLIYSRYTTKEA